MYQVSVNKNLICKP